MITVRESPSFSYSQLDGKQETRGTGSTSRSGWKKERSFGITWIEDYRQFEQKKMASLSVIFKPWFALMVTILLISIRGFESYYGNYYNKQYE